MALDGFVIANLAYELSSILTEGRIQKIAQPEKDALLLTIKKERKNYRLLISAGASLPLVYLTEDNKPSPAAAPNFCMLLRKHLNSARITSIKQFGLERVMEITLEHYNELGDLAVKYLMIECMGKHSNIILLNDEKVILDSIKHISGLVSSVREVLPGKPYFIPNTRDKLDPFVLTKDSFYKNVLEKPMSVIKALINTLTGFSTVMANELAYRSGIDADMSVSALTPEQKSFLSHTFFDMMDAVRGHRFQPCIFTENSIPIEFSAFPLTIYEHMQKHDYKSISEVLERFYAEKDMITRIRAKSSDLRKHITTILDRDRKKLDLQQKQMKDTEKRDKFRIYGEMINTYGYQLGLEDRALTCVNYYDNKEITIPIDPSLTSSENANRYFGKYNKSKRTAEALEVQIAEVKDEILYLESVLNAVEIARKEDDLAAIKDELIDNGYMKRKHGSKKGKPYKAKSKPIHFVSSDGYDIYVGKNNVQNEELTFHFAVGNDWWFHAKETVGSHVIVKSNGEEPPIKTFEEAASLAAYFSKGRGSDKVEVDYTLRKNVKKPNGSKPGFVIYYTNYSLLASSSISGIKLHSKEDQVFLERGLDK
ncbi:MAG: NFACT family protein [Lachnoclostridium sp.]|jgi:predicted ribosome quality control (RQC) complex YloA/Tae2 family protein|nr:NFACT family protein [Lachnoclostridium sp.]